MLRPTKVDATPLSTKDEAIAGVADAKTWYACEWRKQNKNRRLDRARSQGQVYYGLAIERLYWEMPGEPDYDDDDDDAPKALRNRQRAFMDSDYDDTFRIDPVHPLGVMFAPIHDPADFMEEAEINIVEARKLTNDKGQFLDLDEAGKFYFLGDKQPPLQWRDQNAFYGKRLHYICHARKDPDRGWVVTEYVWIGTGGSGSVPNFEADGIQLKETVVPFNRCPYFLIPSGEYDALETDPHLAFKPRMQALYVDIAKLNYLDTKIAAYALRNTNAIAITLAGVQQEYWSWLEAHMPSEGEGAYNSLVLPIPDNGPGEWPVVPHLEKIPFDLDSALIQMRQSTVEEIKNHQPNRFQTGNVSRTEVAEGKATAFANTMEASSLPAEADLGMQDAASVEIFDAMRSAILFWPENKVYPFLTTGDEPLLRGSVEAGEEGFIDSRKMGFKHQVVVLTKNETQAEEQIASLLAAQDETQGIITRRQHLQARGVEDVERQLELLEADQQEKDDAPHVRQFLQQTRLAMFMGLTGANQAALMGLPPPTPSGLPNSSNFPGPVEQTPNRSGTGEPMWKPDFMAQQNQPPPAGQLQPGHGIVPSPIGFGQGSSPTGSGLPGR